MSVVTFNEVGQRLPPRRLLTIFDRLMSPEVLGRAAEEVSVTLVPDDDALARVLAIKRLDRVEIVIKRPNAEDVTAETHDVLADLREQNAKRQEIVLIRAAHSEGLELSEANQKYARVAAAGDGHVKAQGRGGDGEPATRSTKEYPKVVEKLVQAGTTFFGALVEISQAQKARRSRG